MSVTKLPSTEGCKLILFLLCLSTLKLQILYSKNVSLLTYSLFYRVLHLAIKNVLISTVSMLNFSSRPAHLFCATASPLRYGLNIHRRLV